jgi:hypothetical protein
VRGYWLLARCQQAVWAYEEWRGTGYATTYIERLPTWQDAFFGLLSRYIGPVLRG